MFEDHICNQPIAGRIGMAIDLEEQPFLLARPGLEARRQVQVWNARRIELLDEL